MNNTELRENLRVDNFLALKKIDIEVRRINVLIGQQASGKSIVAKLIYFFRSISTNFTAGIRAQSGKVELDKSIKDDFESRFPRYAWGSEEFHIFYEIDGLFITIDGENKKNGGKSLKVSYSDWLTKAFNSGKRSYAKGLEEARQETIEKGASRASRAQYAQYREITKTFSESQYSRFFSSSIFVPASRSFFANLQKNIFTFMASNLEIDPFLKEFGSFYESAKRFYKDGVFSRKPKEIQDSLNNSIEQILDGSYDHYDEQDWIRARGRRVNLVNASSGQQEALPMLLTLAVWPFAIRGEEGNLIFIEEPEAHLFPTSQSAIMSMLSSLVEHSSVGFFITTHSPYVLSALNNNILAYDVIESTKMTREDYRIINNGGEPIRYEDVAAYNIINGNSSSIGDDEMRMIGAEILDGVSDHFEKVMNSLLEQR